MSTIHKVETLTVKSSCSICKCKPATAQRSSESQNVAFRAPAFLQSESNQGLALRDCCA